MKRIVQLVPGFDDIIFQNRNKSYGSYDLRKRYKSAAIFSIIGGVFLFSAPIILFSVLSPEPVTANTDTGIFVVLKPADLLDPEKIVQPVPQKPVKAPPQFKYIEPKVVDDTINLSDLMITEMVMDSVKDERVTENNDSVYYSPPVAEVAEEEEPRIFVEEPAMFPGGNDALLKYIAMNLRYPSEAVENNIQGRVFVRFAVTSTGSVGRIEIMRGLHPLLDDEAKRVISTLPKWKPGRQNGIAVPVWFSVPVTFQIQYN